MKCNRQIVAVPEQQKKNHKLNARIIKILITCSIELQKNTRKTEQYDRIG